ncbi:Hypothetical_protein [Hexamita inflata]|uniref:Hypothetical_protein n=1 Tax=Hexamita inflata TaxID=28002 RepID=A0AA86QKR1_9EUKA|nr:Hypothetical protein HINF_LOCUS45341 [Hexamita inflata]
MIYLDYDSCYRNCYKGICELAYNSLNQTQYTCTPKPYNYYNLFWLFMIIPLCGPIVFTIVFCCCGKNKETVEIVEIKTDPESLLVENKQPKKNQNVTVAVQGQQVTINGQVGIFVPQPQQNDTVSMPVLM